MSLLCMWLYYALAYTFRSLLVASFILAHRRTSAFSLPANDSFNYMLLIDKSDSRPAAGGGAVV